MSNGAEAVGDLVAGALVARAAEPVASGDGGGQTDGHTHETQCLNCGTALIGSHCHSCGQPAHVHRSLSAFAHDFLHGVFHFEGKIWRTLPMLTFRPGRLTREYIDGRRASYISPIALFLFCVFLLFATLKQLGGDVSQFTDFSVRELADQSEDKLDSDLARLRGERDALRHQNRDTSEQDGQIEGLEEARTAMLKAKDKVVPDARKDSKPTVYSDLPQVDAALRKFKDNPGLAIYKLQSSAYKYSWLLIPISVPFVWLMFAWKRRFQLYDHTVFVTYSLCFMSLLAVVLAIANRFNIPTLGVAAVLIPPFHMYRQLRGTYALGRFSALWRTAALLFVALTALILFALAILAESGA